MSEKEKCLDALDYFWSCEDVENKTTDRKHYIKILLNKTAKTYKVEHLYKF